ncbi:hypothetical protein BYT27DRAFT_7261057 [Phlegmacium glaucopus]|nr:hypothetical protein BYT27DRAFT_7261057 [Phlegmacium glaucopus]
MSLDYPISRSFNRRWFTPISLAGAVLVIAILSIVNTALTGYETITVFQSDFNATQTHWFDGFMPFHEPKPGTLCESHVFNVGDPLTTNYSFFQWTIDSIIRPNAGESGLSYSGAPLTFCDVVSVYLDGSLLSWSIDFTVISACVDVNSFNVTARTSFSTAVLPGRYSPLLGLTRRLSDGTEDVRGAILDGLLKTAAQDFGTRTYNAFLFSNHSSAVTFSAQANFNYCPMSLGLNASCAINPPQFNIIAAATVLPNSTIYSYDSQAPTDPTWNPWVLDNDTELAIYNLLQTVYASIRIDLGNPSSNNFILNPAALNGTIAPTFPVTQANGVPFSNSTLYAGWIAPIPRLQKILPVTVSGPATIQVVYPCQFQQRKSTGQLVISVLVATLSMFSTGWAVFMLIATAIVKRNNPTANRCEGHCFQHPLDLDPSGFDTPETYGLQARDFSGTERNVANVKRFSGAVYQPVMQSPSSPPPKDLTTTPDPNTEIDLNSDVLTDS